MKTRKPIIIALVGTLTITTAATTAQAQEKPQPSQQSDDEIETMVVVARKTERPLHTVAAQVTVFGRERLQREQVQELGEISRYEPVLNADLGGARFGTTGLAIRGIGGNRVALEVDGVPLPQQFDVGNFANNSRTALDPEIIQRIEILRGPASVLYGSNAIGGVVTIATADAHDLVATGREHYLGVTTGYFGVNDSASGHVTYARAGQRDGLVVAAGYRGGEAIDNESRDTPSDRVDFDQTQLFGKWTHRFDNGGELRATGTWFERDSDSELRAVLGFERFANTTALSGDDRQQRSRVSLEYRLPSRGWLEQSSILVYRQRNDTRQLTDERRSTAETELALERDFFIEETGHGGEIKGRSDFVTGSLDHTLVAGAEWDRRKLQERRDGMLTDLVTGETSSNLLGEQFPLRDFPQSTTDAVGLYLEDEVRIGELTLIPGLRWDYFKLDAAVDPVFGADAAAADLERDDLTLRFGATYRLTGALTAYTHYAEGFRAPPAEDVNLFLDIPRFNIRAVPNPDLQPERSQNYEFGLRLRRSGLRFESAFYYSDFDNFIESRVPIGPDPQTGVLLFQSRNLARATIYGVEASLSQELGSLWPALRDWRLDTGVHWSRGENDVTQQPLNTVQPLEAVFALRWQPSTRASASLSLRHIGEQDRVDFSDAQFFVPPGAQVLDLSARWQPHPAVEVDLGLFNLTDERYWRLANVRQFEPGDPRIDVASRPGRHLRATLRLRY